MELEREQKAQATREELISKIVRAAYQGNCRSNNIAIGMTGEEALLTWGIPNEERTVLEAGGAVATWEYANGARLTLMDNQVIRAETQSRPREFLFGEVPAR